MATEAIEAVKRGHKGLKPAGSELFHDFPMNKASFWLSRLLRPSEAAEVTEAVEAKAPNLMFYHSKHVLFHKVSSNVLVNSCFRFLYPPP